MFQKQNPMSSKLGGFYFENYQMSVLHLDSVHSLFFYTIDSLCVCVLSSFIPACTSMWVYVTLPFFKHKGLWML